MLNSPEDLSVCNACNTPLTEDNRLWCAKCNIFFCPCKMTSCQYVDCDFSSCSYCIEGHTLANHPGETGTSDLSEDDTTLVLRSLQGLFLGILEIRERIETSADHTNNRLSLIENDILRLNNSDAIAVARDQADLIAEQMGLTCRRLLDRKGIVELSRSQDHSAIPPGDLRGFQRAHLIIEATDDDGAVQYIAVEAAFVATTKHAYRAMVNADLLTRFTGIQAQGVIAAVRIADEIQSEIDNKSLLWYQLDDEN